jgi:hypothetical protein
VSAPRPQPQIAVAYHLAVERNFTAYQTLALIALSELARHGVITASLPAIAHEARQSRREVYNSVHFLADQELVEIVNHPGLATEYRISFGSYEKSSGDEEPVHDVHPPVNDPVHDVHHPSAQRALPDAQRALPPEDDPCTACTTTSAQRAPPLYSLLSLSKEEEEERDIPAALTSNRAHADAAFDAFWEKYPRKRGKDAARKAFAVRLKAGTPPEEILDGLRRHRFTDQKQFIPYPATWLRAGSWTDEPEPGAWDWLDRMSGQAPAADDWDGTTIDGEVNGATYTH